MSLFSEILPLLNGIPESVGLLAAGTVMTASAIFLRGALNRMEARQDEDGAGERAKDQ